MSFYRKCAGTNLLFLPFPAQSDAKGGADGPEKCHGMGAENGLYSVAAR